jgi:hypothetical protein
VAIVLAAAANATSEPGAWLIALISALAGGICGSVLTATVDGLRDKRRAEGHAKAIRAAVRVEVETILSEARVRATPLPDGAVRRDPPLPTQVWGLALASPTPAMPFPALSALARFYRDVERVNYASAQAATYLLIANSTTDRSAADQFSREATAVSTGPYDEMQTSAADALTLLDSLA